MKKKERRYPRSRWVVCLNCDNEYELDVFEFEGCQICGSKEYEPSNGNDENVRKINDSWDDWR